MEEHVIQEPQRTSFAESLASGIGGFIKGAFSGGLIGAIGGAAVGAILALTGVLTGGVGAAALAAAAWGAAGMGAVGALAGTTTGVVQSREKNQVSAQDVVNVATISYAQGMGVGHHLAQEQAAEQKQSHFRDKILKERAARSADQQHVH